MAKGSRSAVPATPMKSGGSRGDDSSAALITPDLEPIAERSVSFEDSAYDGPDAMDEDMKFDDDDLEEKAPMPAMVTPDLPEDAVVSAGRSGNSRPLSRNLVDELNDVAGPEPAYDEYDDDDDDEDSISPEPTTQVTEQASGNRPPVNGDTPAANKVLGRCYEEMKSSDWISLFEPTPVRQALWKDLDHELSKAVRALTADQVVTDTVNFLKAMGLKPMSRPSPSELECWVPAEAGAGLWKWKQKLRSAFGVTALLPAERKEADPSRIPLPTTPRKPETEAPKPKPTTGVFAATGERSPYFQDTHMVTPRSASRSERLARDAGNSGATGVTQRGSTRRSGKRFQADDDSDDGSSWRDFTGDGGTQVDEYLNQIRSVTEAETQNSTPRIEVALHRPLGQIRPYSGLRNKSENSMQWLRSFVYEMRGTRTTPNEWCIPFELSLRDGALHWYRQLPKKTKRQWSLLSEAFIKYYCSQFNQSAEARYYNAKREDKEHICDYLNRLNGYARNAGIKFENGGRKSRDHVRRFLETCGDKGLEKRLCHVQVTDIRELETMIVEILKIDERTSSREPSQPSSRSRESSRRREDRRRDDSRDDYGRRDRRDRDDRRYDDSYGRRERRDDRRRDDSRNIPRVTLAEASVADLVAALHEREFLSDRDDDSSQRQPGYSGYRSDAASDDDSEDSWNPDCDEYTSDTDGQYLAAANDNERRAAAEGTYARPDNRPSRNESSNRGFSRDSRFQNRGDRDGRQRQYGPCAACGSPYHSAHFCRKRCKLCKQVHDAGRCEVLQEIAKIVKNKVDKKDISPELQALLFTEHLN